METNTNSENKINLFISFQKVKHRVSNQNNTVNSRAQPGGG